MVYANPRLRKRMANRDAAAQCKARTHVAPTVAFVQAKGQQRNRRRRPGDETGLQNIITDAQVLKCQCVRASGIPIGGCRSPLVLLTQPELYDSLKRNGVHIISFF